MEELQCQLPTRVAAGFNLARLTREINLALISLGHNIIQLRGNEIAERSRAELGAKAARKMRAVHSRKGLIFLTYGRQLRRPRKYFPNRFVEPGIKVQPGSFFSGGLTVIASNVSIAGVFRECACSVLVGP